LALIRHVERAPFFTCYETPFRHCRDHLDSACYIALPAFAQSISTSAITQEDLPFIDHAQHFYNLLNLESPYEETGAGGVIAHAHASIGRSHCNALEGGVPMQLHRNIFDAHVQQGENRMAMSGLIILAAAIEAYCPEYEREFIEMFPSQ
jgi:hypothetical protein